MQWQPTYLLVCRNVKQRGLLLRCEMACSERHLWCFWRLLQPDSFAMHEYESSVKSPARNGEWITEISRTEMECMFNTFVQVCTSRLYVQLLHVCTSSQSSYMFTIASVPMSIAYDKSWANGREWITTIIRSCGITLAMTQSMHDAAKHIFTTKLFITMKETQKFLSPRRTRSIEVSRGWSAGTKLRLDTQQWWVLWIFFKSG